MTDTTAIRILHVEHPKPIYVSTFAGSADRGYVDGPVDVARFNGLASVVFQNDNLFLADARNNVIRLIADRTVTTLAGDATRKGYLDGVGPSAQFNHPTSLALTSEGHLLIADMVSRRIRIIEHVTETSTYLLDPAVDCFSFETLLQLSTHVNPSPHQDLNRDNVINGSDLLKIPAIETLSKRLPFIQQLAHLAFPSILTSKFDLYKLDDRIINLLGVYLYGNVPPAMNTTPREYLLLAVRLHPPLHASNIPLVGHS